MPYIKQSERKKFEDSLKSLPRIENAGELNYLITKIIHGYFHKNNGRYQQINDILGALEGAKLEFYRRQVSVFEEGKIKINGDIQ